MSEVWLRITVVDAILNILQHSAENEGRDYSDAVFHLRQGPYSIAKLDYPRALDALSVIDVRNIDVSASRETQICAAITSILMAAPPRWSTALYEGRDLVRQSADEDALQTFQYAGLFLEPPSASVEQWWSDIGLHFRAELNRQLLVLGRQGERLTIAVELARLEREKIDKHPEWVALDNNKAGYDVKSFLRRIDEIEPIYIEVKACGYLPMHFYISRREWKFANDHRTDYRLDVWHVDSEQCLNLTADELATHIPRDQGAGKWQDIKVTLWPNG